MKKKNDVAMMWMMSWLNKSVTTINATLHASAFRYIQMMMQHGFVRGCKTKGFRQVLIEFNLFNSKWDIHTHTHTYY